MTPERWARVVDLFDRLCEQPESERVALAEVAADDPGVRDELLRMLAAYERDPGFMEGGADVPRLVHEAVSSRLPGRRIGAYRLVRQLGHGGMAVVYEAVRDDQEFDRRAAIKILPVWQTASFAERFKFEGRILAGLDHPGIARLIDSGTTPDGISYIVMEHVAGEPVTDWCQRRQLGVRECVAIIERIAQAVAYAHRNLVVHRDLKPSNILVTPEGEPKLLDFGIAALLADDGASVGRTQTGHHSFTLQFASPEQVRGERVTTATDVYSLGVLLYLLLTGRHPNALDGLAPLEAMRAVCEAEPAAPSAVADPKTRATLRGDLDAILGKALRKVPGERYATMDDFAADLRAWRTGRPVAARPSSVVYRARRFAGRNKGGVAATAAVCLALAAGAAATAWQARVASQERDKARKRFVQVQEFSRSLLFDVHNALRDLPGATEPRRLLLDRAVQFLDGLAADAADDDPLTLELVEGYRRLGHVQGGANSQNVGDTAGALRSFERASGLAEAALARRPDDPERLVLALNAVSDLASVLRQRGESERSARTAGRHLELLERLATHADDPRAVTAAANGYTDAGGHAADVREYGQAVQYYRRSLALLERVPPERRTGQYSMDLAIVHKRLGAVLMVTGDLGGSEGHYTRALALDEETLAVRRDARTEYAITFTMSDLALVFFRQGQVERAVEWWTRALAIRRAAMAADDKDVRARGGVATLLARLATAARVRRDFTAAARHLSEEVALREELIAREGALPRLVTERAWARLRLADTRVQQAEAMPADQAAAAWIREARELFRRTTPSEGRLTVSSGNESDFLALYATLSRRFGR